MDTSVPSSATSTQGAKFSGALIRALLVFAVLFVAGFFAWMVSQRLTYPFELEWMEGAMADHVARVWEGQLIYTAPGYEHVAYLYHPGFFYLAALVGEVTTMGHALTSLRIVSVLATVLTCVFLFRLVRREGTPIGGLVAIGVYLASYFLAGCYYDTGRIDPLFSCLLLGGIDQLRASRSWKGLLIAGTWFLMAWLTKQTTAVILPIVVLGSLPGNFRRGVGFGIGVAAVCGLSVWGLDILHDGWLSYFTLELPRNHGFEAYLLPLFWSHDLPPMVIGLLLFGVFVRRCSDRRAVVFHLAWITACFVGGVMSRLHEGGAENVLLPTIAAVAAGSGLGVSALGRSGFSGRCWGEGLALVQLASLFCLPFLPLKERYSIPQIPTAESTRLSEHLVSTLRASAAPVFLPWHGYISRLAGKPATAHIMAIDDVWRSRDPKAIEAMESSIRNRLLADPSPVVYVSDTNTRFLKLMESCGYRMDQDLKSEFQFHQTVGAPFFPRVTMVRDR